MAYIDVQIDIEDYLDEVSTDTLKKELQKRGVGTGADFEIPAISAREALDASSMIMRKIGRIDLAYKLDEIRIDYFQR